MSKSFSIPELTSEYWEEISRCSYIDDRKYPENFSNWYRHITDFGYFRHAEVISNQIFTQEDVKFMRKTDYFDDVDWKAMNELLKPTIDKMVKHRVYSIKNGTFSNKFNFKTSMATTSDLAQQLWNINYYSTMLDTGGYTELVVREFIPSDDSKVPTIYNGMPLREELRVFYNMDTKDIEYIVDYWDYDYCNSNISNKSDNIVFNWFHNKIGDRDVNHKEILDAVEKQIRDNIHTLKFDDKLNGIWSIDFMYVDDLEDFKGIWLIDMARGFRSAYWNPKKCKDLK